ncbi:MAG: ketopantoate reductase family protein [Clostridia bacterium]|nr:ketopantoate reductase family protein [Clostridia bacterium]
MKILVIGAGAIGSIMAAFMAQAGEDVTLVCKHRETADRANGQGLHITGIQGDHWIRVNAVTEIEEVEGNFDACLIVTKAYDMPDAARRVLPHLTPESMVVSMQNGICLEKLAEIVGRNRVVGCMMGFGATMTGRGEAEMTSTGDLVIGTMDGMVTDSLKALATALGKVTRTQTTTHIYEQLYSKLIVNSCITSLGAICGLKLGEMMRRGDARRIFLNIIDEAVRIARAMKLNLPPYGGKLDYYALMKGDRWTDDFRRHATIFVVGLKYRNLKSSSLQSLERGQRTEVDSFNGYLADMGRQMRVSCPVNRRLVQMVHEIEEGKREISLKNLEDPVLQGEKNAKRAGKHR